MWRRQTDGKPQKKGRSKSIVSMIETAAGELPNRPSGRRRFCAVRAFCRRQNLGAGAIHLPRAFQSPEGGAALWAAEPRKKTVKIDSFNGWDSRRTGKPAFWPAALLRRTSVLPQAKPRRRGNSFAPSISITGGWSRPLGGGTQKKGHDIVVSFFLVRPTGLEPAAFRVGVIRRSKANPLQLRIFIRFGKILKKL